MSEVWSVLLIALGGVLFGGVVALWKTTRVLAVVLGACAVPAVAAGVLRLGYFTG